MGIWLKYFSLRVTLWNCSLLAQDMVLIVQVIPWQIVFLTGVNSGVECQSDGAKSWGTFLQGIFFIDDVLKEKKKKKKNKD